MSMVFHVVDDQGLCVEDSLVFLENSVAHPLSIPRRSPVAFLTLPVGHDGHAGDQKPGPHQFICCQRERAGPVA